MNLYEAIFSRKSVRKFRMEAVEEDLLAEIGAFYSETPALYPGIETEIGIINNTDGKHPVSGLFKVSAPYYLSIYSEKRDRSLMNAGYLGEQLALFLMTRGLGSCFLGSAHLKKEEMTRGGKELVILLAFGKPAGSLTRRVSEAKREPMSRLCVYKDEPRSWMQDVLEAARLAPSALNTQPWRFVVTENRIHIFSKNRSVETLKKWDEFNFGVMFAHIMIVSEEKWLDLDLIRLENISQKNFRSNQYVLSAVMKNRP